MTFVLSLLVSGCADERGGCSKSNPASPAAALSIALMDFRADLQKRPNPRAPRVILDRDCCIVRRRAHGWFWRTMPIREHATEYVVRVRTRIPPSGRGWSSAEYRVASCGRISESFISRR